MKNVWILILFGLLGAKGFGQNLQNARWYFGNNAGLLFTPTTNPTSLSGNILDFWEASATVSDQNGNLLFYTNGERIIDKTHNTMAGATPSLIGSGLNGNNSSTQGALIVPKPRDPDKYYVFTIDGTTGGQKGFYYNTVHIPVGSNGTVTEKNHPLKDGSGILINNSYGNKSEKLTSAKHGNGVDYWVVTQINNKFLSYLITSSTTISDTPAKISNAMFDFPNAAGGSGAMKISPDGKRIAICYTNYDGNGRISVGSFCSSTGEIILDSTFINFGQLDFYGIEFSPDSQNIYFTSIGGPGYSKLYKMKANGQQVTLIATIDDIAGLQLAINNKIYLSKFDDANYYNIGVINDPDNFTSPNFIDNTVNLGGKQADGGLPQWVHWHYPAECTKYWQLSSPIDDVCSGLTSIQDHRQAEHYIEAANKICTGYTAIYHAGEDVLLLPGFNAASGSHFRGYIEGCSGEFEARIGNFSQSEETDESRIETLEDITFFTIAPNPASTAITITGTEAIQSILITSLDGKTLYSKTLRDKTNSFDVVIDGYSNGLYNVTVTTASGKVETQKLVKN